MADECGAKCPRSGGEFELSLQYDCWLSENHPLPHRNQFRTEWVKEFDR